MHNKKAQILLLAFCSILFILVIKPWELYFLNDDFMHIPMPNKWLFLRGGFLRPVPNFVLLWDKWLYGTNATGFFITTLIFHLASVYVVYFLVRECIANYYTAYLDKPLAIFTAILFLFYPFHDESIMWVIARVSIIATFFALWSLVFYIKSAKRKLYFFLSWLCFVIALFTYESIWNIILIFAVFSLADVYWKLDSKKSTFLRFIIMAITFGGYILLRILLLNSIAGDGYLEINQNIRNIPLLFVNLVKLTGRIYTPPFEYTFKTAAFFIVSTMGYLFLIFRTFKSDKRLGWLLILLCCFVVTGVITAAPLGIDTHSNESDRYLYYASFFYCFFIAVLAFALLTPKVARALLFSIIILFGFFLAVLQRKYAFASSVTRTTIEFVKKHGDFKRGYFIDVPRSYKGALIFRISLGEAISWMTPNKSFDSVIVVSQQDFKEKHLPYKEGTISWSVLSREKGWNALHPVIETGSRTYTLKEEDIVYWFKKDGIYEVVRP